MLNFVHESQRVEVPSGGTWAAPAARENYHDTAVEKLRVIVAAVEQGAPWREVVATHCAARHPWLHRIVTDPARALFVRQHPPAAGARVLDIGAGWGQITLPLARDHAALVTALEPTPERLAFIRAAAAQEGVTDRLHFIQANFQELDFGPAFDLVCCIGVLEWVPRFQPGEPRALQRDFLRRMRAALRPGGRCCLGIENRLGLKYLLGARDDHTSQRLVSVFDSSLAAAKHHRLTGQELRVFTHTQAEYEQLFREAGFTRITTHAAFPDYKLPELILPLVPPAEFNRALLDGPIPAEHDGVEGQLLPHPEEYVSHYRSLAALGVAQYFCPSFFFTLE